MRLIFRAFPRQCYCGADFVGSGGTVEADAGCSATCSGDVAQLCGGQWLLSLYKYTAPAASLCSSNSNTTAPTATAAESSVIANATATATASSTLALNATMSVTATSAAVTPTSTAPVVDGTDGSEWYSLGCAVDEHDARLLPFMNPADAGMTIDSCLIQCEDAGYAYAGVEYGVECWCGSALPASVAYDNETTCYIPCKGNASETCGGDYRMEVFELISSDSADCGNDTATTSTILNSNHIAVSATTTGTATGVATTATGGAAAGTATTKTAATSATSTGTVSTPTTTVPPSSGPHQVYAHHMVGNTYPYTQADWAKDIALAKAAGIDGFALNMGSDWWQPLRVADAYAAANAAGSFTMFLSLDMTSMGCGNAVDAATIVTLVALYAGNSAQATFNNRPLVSTFSGENCQFGLGNTATGWMTLFKNALQAVNRDVFFVPSLFSDPSTFGSDDWMDGELNWNSGWPTAAHDLDTSSDVTYMNALGNKEYMPAISPAFFTHFPPSGWNKNWIYRSDDWLFATRWEQVIAMRDKVHFTEILTWNDFGESSYIGPIEGGLPAGSEVWVNGFPHTGWLDLNTYYATAFKTGAYPAITQDKVIMWSRPHPKDATASADSMSRPDRWQYTDDELYAIVFATAPGTVTLVSGSTSTDFAVTAGVNKIKMPSAVGSIGATLKRSNQQVFTCNSGSDFSYTNNPTTYNFNYYVTTCT